MSADLFARALQSAATTLQSLEPLQPQLVAAADLVLNSLASGHKILACGNGGSAADAADFTTEFACRFVQDRRPYPALNLSQGGSLVTATGNDYGFEEIFARQVRAFGNTGDVLVAITTSGKSENIRRAIVEGNARELTTITLLGRDGGTCAGLANVELLVKADSTARIQEAHKFLLHTLCEMVEADLPRD